MNRRIKNDSLSATHLFQNSSQWIMQSMLWTWKMNKFHAFFKVTVFCFYPARMTQVLSWSPAPSSGLSFLFLWKKPYYENRLKKKKKLAAVSTMWKLMRMTQMDVIRFARCRELGLIGISLHVNMRIRHRNYRTIL